MSYSPGSELVFKILGDRPVAYHPKLARAVGGVKQTIFVCQLLYWDGKGKDPEGWVYKTQPEIEEETGLTRYEQETVRKSLCAMGVLEEKLAGVPAKLHYRLNLSTLYDAIQFAYTPQSSLQEHPKLDCDNTPNLDGDSLQSPQESTQKITPVSEPDFLDVLLAQASSPEVKARRAMRARFTEALGKTPNWDSSVKHSNWAGLETFLLAEDKAGRKIETWATWWLSDEFRAQHGVAYLTAEKVRENWGLAFVNATPSTHAQGKPAFRNQPNRPLPTGV